MFRNEVEMMHQFNKCSGIDFRHFGEVTIGPVPEAVQLSKQISLAVKEITFVPTHMFPRPRQPW